MRAKLNVFNVMLAVYHLESNGLGRNTIQALKDLMESLSDRGMSKGRTNLKYAVMGNQMIFLVNRVYSVYDYVWPGSFGEPHGMMIPVSFVGGLRQDRHQTSYLIWEVHDTAQDLMPQA